MSFNMQNAAGYADTTFAVIEGDQQVDQFPTISYNGQQGFFYVNEVDSDAFRGWVEKSGLQIADGSVSPVRNLTIVPLTGFVGWWVGVSQDATGNTITTPLGKKIPQKGTPERQQFNKVESVAKALVMLPDVDPEAIFELSMKGLGKSMNLFARQNWRWGQLQKNDGSPLKGLSTTIDDVRGWVAKKNGASTGAIPHYCMKIWLGIGQRPTKVGAGQQSSYTPFVIEKGDVLDAAEAKAIGDRFGDDLKEWIERMTDFVENPQAHQPEAPKVEDDLPGWASASATSQPNGATVVDGTNAGAFPF